MRKLGGWLLVLLGVLLAASGTAAAIIIGPDDALDDSGQRIESAGAAIVTGPGAIEYAGPTLLLDVTSQNGPVFVGVGAQVDVQDFVSTATRTQIDEIDFPSDLHESTVDGSQDYLAEGPDLDWWLSSATGEHAVLQFALPDHPVSVVVMNQDGASDVVVDVQAGLEIPGVFWGAIAVTVIGIGVLIIGVLMLRRGRSRPGQEPSAAVTGEDS